MNSVRINISLPKDIISELSREIEPRKRSRFITDAIKHSLKEQRARKLAAEYKDAAAEMSRVSQELDGVVADGLD